MTQQDPGGDAATEVFYSVEEAPQEVQGVQEVQEVQGVQVVQGVQEGAPECQCVNSNMVRSSSDAQFSSSSGEKVQPVQQ